jgi:hypothetical protein
MQKQKGKDTAVEIYLEHDHNKGTVRVITPDVSSRTITLAEKKHNPTAFPRTESVNVRSWAEWGQSDNLPNFIYRRLSSVPIALQAIYKMAQDIYGNGLVYYKKKDFYEGNFVRAYDTRIEEFFRINRTRTHWLPNQALSRLLMWNAFSQMDLDGMSGKKIVKLYHLETMWSRLSKQNPLNNEIEYLKYSGKFGSLEMPSDKDILTLPLYRWYKDDFFQWLKGYSFVWHTKGLNMGATYYPRPFWLGLLDEKSWLDVAKNVPRIVYALQDNQASIKYVMRVSRDYFKFKYPDWNSYNDKKQRTLIDEFEIKVQASLTGIDNVGKLLTLYLAEENGKFVGTIEIEALDDKLKQDAWIPSSAVAGSEIFNAIGFHGSQMSLTNEGGKMGAGSGSDARVHFNSQVLRNTLEQMEILEPLQFVFDFNGWDYIVMIDNFSQTTTDKAATGVGSGQGTTDNGQSKQQKSKTQNA